MNLTIKGRNVEVTDALHDYVEKRFSKLEKYFNDELKGNVTLIIEKNDHIAEATIPINRFILRAEDSSGDMYTSIDKIVDKLERQIHKYKTRINRKGKQVRNDVDFFPLTNEVPEPSEDDFSSNKIVKIKQFDLLPMDPEEAIMQLELLDHDFYVFLNGDTGKTEIVYRRRDGKYGLIQPQVK